MTSKISDQKLENIIKQIPKNDLHVHLDGSVRLETIIEISKKENLELPSFTIEGLNTTLFKDNYTSLEEYLTTFGYSCGVMQKPEYLERIAYELAVDNQNEGVRYIEVRFAPQLHINESMDMERVMTAVNSGLARAQKEYNSKPEIAGGKEPGFYYGIIMCAMRNIGRWSPYYDKFISSFPYSKSGSISRLASLELARGAIRIRDDLGIPIVGFDLAGAESGFPAKNHWESFQYVHENFMHKTVHAGEAHGPESIFQAITELHADRIGHGFYLFDTTKINSDRIKKKDAFVHNLSQFIADRRITIEVCLTSNLQTNPAIGEIANHSIVDMLKNNICTTLCTDNRTVSKTTITKEILLAIKHLNLSEKTLKNILVHGFKRSFYPGNYAQKRKYVRQCINMYEDLTKGIQLV